MPARAGSQEGRLHTNIDACFGVAGSEPVNLSNMLAICLKHYQSLTVAEGLLVVVTLGSPAAGATRLLVQEV